MMIDVTQLMDTQIKAIGKPKSEDEMGGNLEKGDRLKGRKKGEVSSITRVEFRIFFISYTYTSDRWVLVWQVFYVSGQPRVMPRRRNESLTVMEILSGHEN